MKRTLTKTVNENELTCGNLNENLKSTQYLTQKLNYSFREDFQYKHNNPYHDRLSQYSDFILRDHDAELHRSKWNNDVFKRKAPLCLEIGCGFGHFMYNYCEDHSGHNFIGLDYRFKRSFNLAKKLSGLHENSHQHFRLLRAKGERLDFLFGENELDVIFYFFPDPWPKVRHHKKRLFQKTFLQSVYKCLAPDGKFYIKTDHDGLFQWMIDHVEQNTDLFNVELVTWNLHEQYPEHFLAKYQTKFEKIFIEKKIPTKFMVLTSKKNFNS